MPSFDPITVLSKQSLLSLLLLFSFFYLPRSPAYFSSNQSNPPIQHSSADRPEHPFLTPITSDPLGSSLWQLTGVIFSMLWWGDWLRELWVKDREGKKKGVNAKWEDESREVAEKQGEMGRRLVSAQQALITTLSISILIFLLILLFGAPTTSHLLHSLTLSLHLSFLLAYPLFNALGVPSIYEKGIYDRFRLSRLLCEGDLKSPLEKITVLPIVGTVIGAWIGVIPFALDWDRPWQSYPLPPIFCSTIGFLLGCLIASFSVGNGIEEQVDTSIRQSVTSNNKVIGKSSQKSRSSRRR